MVFGTIADDSKESGEALSLFHKRFTDVINDYKSVSDDKIGIGKLRTGLSTSYITKNDLDKLKNFEQSIHSYVGEADFAEKANNELTASFSKSSSTVKANAQKIIDLNNQLKTGKINQEAYSTAVGNFTTAQKKQH